MARRRRKKARAPSNPSWRHGPFVIDTEWTPRGWVYVTRDQKGVQQDGAPKTFDDEDEALRFALGRLPQLRTSPMPIGVIGDPWRGWGFGILYDNGNGTGILRHFHPNDVYRVSTIPIPDDVAAAFPWVDWKYVARRTGQDDPDAIKAAGRGSDLRWRAYALDHIGRAYNDHHYLAEDVGGATEELSEADAMKRFGADVDEALERDYDEGRRERHDNPDWSNRLLAEHSLELVSLVGPRLMPRQHGARQRSMPKYVEYGYGDYGVALPTQTPGVVLKLTTDPQEASFVLASFAMGPPPVGIVRYYGIAQLQGAQHDSRNVFALWREEAVEIDGFSSMGIPTAPEQHDLDESESLTTTWMQIARDMYRRYGYLIVEPDRYRNAVVDALGIAFGLPPRHVDREADELVRWHYFDAAAEPTRRHAPKAAPGKRKKPPRRSVVDDIVGLATHLRALEIIGEELEETRSGMWVGAALRQYLAAGIILPDLHGGNIGIVRRSEHDPGLPVYEGGVLVYAITDPSVAIFLDDRWAEATALTPRNLPRLPRWGVAA